MKISIPDWVKQIPPWLIWWKRKEEKKKEEGERPHAPSPEPPPPERQPNTETPIEEPDEKANGPVTIEM